MKKMCDRENMSQTHFFFLKLLAMKLESNRRHLACNQIKNKIRVQTRWQFITENMRKSSLKLANSRDFHTKCLFY